MTSGRGAVPGPSATARSRWARHRRAALLLSAAGASAMSVLWFRVLPGAVDDADGWREIALRHGHGTCWALLALSLVVGAADGPPRLRTALAWSALGAYGAFVLALVLG